VKPQNRLTQRGKWKKYYLPPLNSLILQIQNLLGGVGGDPLKVLQETSGNKRKASEILGIDRTTLYKILQKEDV
jgi:transcriptional regulator with AAA-type ATPase domain